MMHEDHLKLKHYALIKPNTLYHDQDDTKFSIVPNKMGREDRE